MIHHQKSLTAMIMLFMSKNICSTWHVQRKKKEWSVTKWNQLKSRSKLWEREGCVSDRMDVEKFSICFDSCGLALMCVVDGSHVEKVCDFLRYTLTTKRCQRCKHKSADNMLWTPRHRLYDYTRTFFFCFHQTHAFAGCLLLSWTCSATIQGSIQF